MFSRIKKALRAHREKMRSVSSNHIIALALENGGKITAPVLAARTSLSVGQANMKLYGMSGVFYTKYDYRDQSQVFVLKKPELYRGMNLTQPVQAPSEPVSQGPSDAEVIQLALKAKGRITPGVLCVKAEISIDEAKKKLQELQHKGVFDIDATESGGLVYVLNELDSYEELLD